MSITENGNYYNLEVVRPNFISGGGLWKLENLTPITVVFGKNGSGKSWLLRNIRDKDPETRVYTVPERAGQIKFNSGSVDNEMNAQTRAKNSKQNFAPTYRELVMARLQAFFAKRGASKNQQSPENLIEIETSLLELIPDFNFKIKTGLPPFEITRLENNENIDNITQLSSGETELLVLGLDLILSCEIWELEEKEGMLLIDEPDTHLHPDMQQRLAKFIVSLHHRFKCRIIISTHSTTFLAGLGQYGSELTSIVYLNRNENHAARPFDDVLKTLTTCLGGHALMGPLFNVPILLVEGDDDYRIWSEIPRHQKNYFAVIPCGGEEIFNYQKSLENLFSSIIEFKGVPSGYVLLDGDKTKPECKQDLMKFIVLSCHESENLYLTDEVLKVLGFDTWNDACDKVIENAHNFGNKEDELKTIKTWDRKNGDCKKMINELSKILDEKNLPWSYRIGKVLGSKKPEGLLADFLGTDVVTALWK